MKRRTFLENSLAAAAATASARPLGARAAASGSEATALRAIQERFTRNFLRSAAAGVPEPAEMLAATLRPDGSCADLEAPAPPVCYPKARQIHHSCRKWQVGAPERIERRLVRKWAVHAEELLSEKGL